MQKKSVRSTNGQHTAAGICGVRTQRRSHHHHTGHPVETSAGAGMQRLASTVPQLQHERGGAYWQTKAVQTSRLSPNSHLFPNKTKTCGSVYSAAKCEWRRRREQEPVNFLKESFADEETCGDRYRIEHAGRWLDQRVVILADQPLCSDELDEQLSSILCQYRSSSFSRSLPR